MENLQNWQRDICHLWDLNLWPYLPYLPTRFYLIECMFLHCENCGSVKTTAHVRAGLNFVCQCAWVQSPILKFPKWIFGSFPRLISHFTQHETYHVNLGKSFQSHVTWMPVLTCKAVHEKPVKWRTSRGASVWSFASSEAKKGWSDVCNYPFSLVVCTLWWTCQILALWCVSELCFFLARQASCRTRACGPISLFTTPFKACLSMLRSF